MGKMLTSLVLLAVGCGASVSEVPSDTPALPDATRLRALHVHFGPIGEAASPLAESVARAVRRATGGEIDVEISERPAISFPRGDAHAELDRVRTRYPFLMNEDASRVWYSDDPGSARLLADLRAPVAALAAEGADLIIVTTTAQVEGVGFFYAGLAVPVVVVETLSLGGWARPSVYARIPAADAFVADVVTHEIGHFFGLGHACSECRDGDEACCSRCAEREDVMSYCRARPMRGEQTNVFSAPERAQIAVASSRRLAR